MASFIGTLESPLNVPNFKDLLPASSANMTLQNPDEVQPSSQTSSDHASSYLFPFPEQFVYLACNYVASLVVCLHSSLCVCILCTSHVSTLRAGTVVLYLLDRSSGTLWTEAGRTKVCLSPGRSLEELADVTVPVPICVLPLESPPARGQASYMPF